MTQLYLTIEYWSIKYLSIGYTTRYLSDNLE